jgi:hypothetical protein
MKVETPGRPAMTMEPAPVGEHQVDTDFDHHLAAEIVGMLPYVREDAVRVLRLARAILDLPAPPQRGIGSWCQMIRRRLG